MVPQLSMFLKVFRAVKSGFWRFWNNTKENMRFTPKGGCDHENSRIEINTSSPFPFLKGLYVCADFVSELRLVIPFFNPEFPDPAGDVL